MSGGVDSSLSGVLLLERGLSCGVTIASCEGKGESDTAIKVPEICALFSIPHYVWDFSREFED